MTPYCLKIYLPESGWSRLSMLSDYLHSRRDPQCFHLFITPGYTLNSDYLNSANTLCIENDALMPMRLKETLALLLKKFTISTLMLSCEYDAVMLLLAQVLQSVPAALANAIELHLYESQPAQQPLHQQLLALPAITLNSLADTEQQQLAFWLKHPEQPLINQGRQMTHLAWQRFYPVTHYWFSELAVCNSITLAAELAGRIQPVHLQDRNTLTQTEKMTLCLMQQVDKATLLHLVNPHEAKQWICDSRESAWFAAESQLADWRSTIPFSGQVVYFSQARNLTRVFSSPGLTLLPRWFSPEIATLFSGPADTFGGNADSWSPLAHPVTASLTLPLKAPCWYFSICDAMGDLLFLLGSLDAFRRTHPGNIVIITRDILVPLAQRCPAVDAVWGESQLAQHADEIQQALKDKRVFECIDTRIIFAPMHQQAAICERINTPFSEATQRLVLPRSDMERENVRRFMEQHQLQDQRVVLLHPVIGSPNRSWPQASWRELSTRFLHAGWQVVMIGSNHNTCHFKTMPEQYDQRIINAVDRFSPLETIELMEHCDLLIATDTGPVALAAASHIAVCALYSVIPGQYRIPIRRGKTGWNSSAINSGCGFGQCGAGFIDPAFRQWLGEEKLVTVSGHAFSDWCPADDKFACLRHYTSEQFWQAIQAFLESDAYIAQSQRPLNLSAAP